MKKLKWLIIRVCVGAKKKIGYGFSTLDILYIDDIFPEEKLKQKIRSGGRGGGA
jgi:hypothetical protein